MPLIQLEMLWFKLTYRVTSGSPRQLRLCVVVRILFMFRWTYFRAMSTSDPILRKEADTRMDTTLSGSNDGASQTLLSASESKYLF